MCASAGRSGKPESGPPIASVVIRCKSIKRAISTGLSGSKRYVFVSEAFCSIHLSSFHASCVAACTNHAIELHVNASLPLQNHQIFAQFFKQIVVLGASE